MKKLVLSLIIAIISYSTSNASELSIVAHGFSKHLHNHNFNEQNYGGALRYEYNDFALQVGAYRNSVRRDSTYAGIDWSPLRYNTKTYISYEAGTYVGAATGYKYSVIPLAGIQAAVRCKDYFARIRVMSDLFYNSRAVGAVEVGIVIKKF
jgi:hypothetical protein